MARFHGEIGYGETRESAPGVWTVDIVEFPYYGDVIRDTRKLDSGEKVNSDISVANSISVLADKYAIDHYFKIKYVRWMDVLWTVTTVEVKPPRLILSLGGIYNAPEN